MNNGVDEAKRLKNEMGRLSPIGQSKVDSGSSFQLSAPCFKLDAHEHDVASARMYKKRINFFEILGQAGEKVRLGND